MPASRTLCWYLQNQILPGLALYQLLREDGLSQDAALDKIAQTFVLVAARDHRQMKLLGRLPFVYPLSRLVIKPAMNQYPASGWAIEWVENSPQAVRFNMKSCFYHDTLAAYGAPELTASFCTADDLPGRKDIFRAESSHKRRPRFRKAALCSRQRENLWIGNELEPVNDLALLVQIFISEPGINPTARADEEILDLVEGIVLFPTASGARD